LLCAILPSNEHASTKYIFFIALATDWVFAMDAADLCNRKDLCLDQGLLHGSSSPLQRWAGER